MWGDEQAASRNVVEVYVGYLRRKLDAVGAGDVVRTVRGHGYLVVARAVRCRCGPLGGGRGARCGSRITLTVGAVALVALLALSRLATALAFDALVDATDAGAARAGRAGRRAARRPERRSGAGGAGGRHGAGGPVDGGPPLPLDARQVAVLAAGEGATDAAVLARRGGWVAVPAIAPDGTPRLVVASADLVGGTALMRRAAGLAVLGAGVRGAGRGRWRRGWRRGRRCGPVDRLRTAAAALPPGDRLPRARGARRAAGAGRGAERAAGAPGRGGGPAASGSPATPRTSCARRWRRSGRRPRSPSPIPDPALAEETLRAVAVEAERLTALLADLLALARADAGQRPPAEPVDLVAAARAAIGRQNRHGAVVQAGRARAGRRGGEPRRGARWCWTTCSATRCGTPGAVVQVGVLPAGRTVRLVVEDDGPGHPGGGPRPRVRPVHPAGPGRREPGAAAARAWAWPWSRRWSTGRGGTVAAGEAAGGGARLEVRWPAARPSPPRESAREPARVGRPVARESLRSRPRESATNWRASRHVRAAAVGSPARERPSVAQCAGSARTLADDRSGDHR